jgi:hypothetical protein
MPNLPIRAAVCLAALLLVRPAAGAADPTAQKAEMAGYLLVPHGRWTRSTTPGFPCTWPRGRC